MRFFQEFKTDIVSIGNEFKDRIINIPKRGEIVLEQLPNALVGFVVVLCMLAIIAIAILIFSKVMACVSGKKEKNETAPVAAAPAAPAVNQVRSLDLIDVDESTAAVIMAIVSEESGIPLDRLSFKSIKKVEDEK